MEDTGEAKARLFPIWCRGLNRKLLWPEEAQKPHCPQKGDVSGSPLGAGNRQGLCTSHSAHHNPGRRSKYYLYSAEDDAEAQRAQELPEEVRHNVELAPRGPKCPGLLPEMARTGSWEDSFQANCSQRLVLCR